MYWHYQLSEFAEYTKEWTKAFGIPGNSQYTSDLLCSLRNSTDSWKDPEVVGKTAPLKVSKPVKIKSSSLHLNNKQDLNLCINSWIGNHLRTMTLPYYTGTKKSKTISTQTDTFFSDTTPDNNAYKWSTLSWA